MADSISPSYGAPASTWRAVAGRLGLGEDMLPIICRPGAKISPVSNLTKLGKVPSVWRGDEVIGLPQWTSLRPDAATLERWARMPDCGIGLQCRIVRGIDIDIDDYTIVNEIVQLATDALGAAPVVRARPNSAKRLLMIRIEGTIGKRRMLHPKGCVELLGNGQQFVFAGTHESGEAYYIANARTDGAPGQIPSATMEALNDFWLLLCAKFGGLDPAGDTRSPEVRVRNSPNTPAVMVHDPILEQVGALAIGKGAEGQVFIKCPWEDQHTTKGNGTSTVYFPAGTRGYAQGHFTCLHAHCAHRTDQEYMDALGICAARDDFHPLVNTTGEPLPPPTRLVRRKDGRIEASLVNLATVLSKPEACGVDIRWDNFHGQVLYKHYIPPAPTHGTQLVKYRRMLDEEGLHDGWRRWEDSDYTALRLRLERNGFVPISRQMIVDSVHLSARENRFDSAIEWLDSISWDGVPRIAASLTRYFGARDTEYVTAVGMYMWTALAGRVMEPGVKADMVPVFIGAQGDGKSFGVAELVPAAALYEGVDLQDRDADLSRKMRGRLVLEIGELQGMASRDVESLKAFITRRFDTWIPKYQECALTYPRRSLFIGTTNRTDFLTDTTGNRRWLPIETGRVDTGALRRDREQLWAEARECFNAAGVAWYKAQKMGTLLQERHRAVDPWEEAIERWARAPEVQEAYARGTELAVTIECVLREALQLEPRNRRRADQMRVAESLRTLGFKRIRHGSQTLWVRDITRPHKKVLYYTTNAL